MFVGSIGKVRILNQICSRKVPQELKYSQSSRFIHLPMKNPITTKTARFNSLNCNSGSINILLHAVGVHTSPPRPSKGIPPEIWQLILNMLRVLAVNAGRSWKNRPQDAKQLFFEKANTRTIASGGVILSIFGYLFYVAHLEECPITKRKKFIMFSEENMTKMAIRESEIIRKEFRGKVISSGDTYKYVSGISYKILKSNRHLPGIKRDWRVFVIDKSILNAFVLPNGHIFVFTGMIKAVNNEDQLAAIMGHEIAHAVLNHVGESISKVSFFEIFLLLPVLILWIIFPDAVAHLSQKFTEYMSNILFKLPMSRQLETEADMVGLKMMARACYDPREAVTLWQKMAKLSQGQPIEWLSTHPSHKTRYVTLSKLMPEAMGIYSKHCNK